MIMLVELGVGRQPGTGAERWDLPGSLQAQQHSSTRRLIFPTGSGSLRFTSPMYTLITRIYLGSTCCRYFSFFFSSLFFPSPLFSSLCPLLLLPSLLFLFPLYPIPPSFPVACCLYFSPVAHIAWLKGSSCGLIKFAS